MKNYRFTLGYVCNDHNTFLSLTQKTSSKHLGPLCLYETKRLGTSNMHNETLLGLRQIDSSFSSIAHSMLDDAGQLRKTRLAK